MKSATSLTPPSPGLKQYSILNTKCIGVIDSEGPEKYNILMKSGRVFSFVYFCFYQKSFCRIKIVVVVYKSQLLSNNISLLIKDKNSPTDKTPCPSIILVYVFFHSISMYHSFWNVKSTI